MSKEYFDGDLFGSHSFNRKDDDTIAIRSLWWRMDDLNTDGLPTRAPRLYTDVLMSVDMFDSVSADLTLDKVDGEVRKQVRLDLNEMYGRGPFAGVPIADELIEMRTALEE